MNYINKKQVRREQKNWLESKRNKHLLKLTNKEMDFFDKQFNTNNHFLNNNQQKNVNSMILDQSEQGCPPSPILNKPKMSIIQSQI